MTMVPRADVFAEEGEPPDLPSRSSLAVYSTTGAPIPRTLWDVLEATAALFPHAGAIDDGRTLRDYTTLVDDVRQLADRLEASGVGRGDRVGIRVPSGTADLYIAILGVLAVGAAYVPVDLDDPDERADVVWSEAGVCAVIGDACQLLPGVLPPSGTGSGHPRPEDDAWIIFTSGSTGKPKGVAVTHRSAAAFVDAEAQLFLREDPLGPGDRVLAGLSVAFDASCEEMWLAWRHGACLVPAPRAVMKTGPELGPWLVERRITVVSTVPTMASLWPVGTLKGVRLLILGGEACPAGLADRLSEQCPEVWNTYGPTEATVVACAARLIPGEAVRIGLPLAGWQLAVVDPDSGQPVDWGESGELVIGGVGVARYLDMENDAAKFSPLEALGAQRVYRSGDLVQADPRGLVYLGRADTQVKIRGYRIELSEIESVLMRLPGVAQAVVTTHEAQPGVVELAAFYSASDGENPPDRAALFHQLRRQLPGHMVPAYLDRLPEIPLLASGKADRKNLPQPTGSGRAVDRRAYTLPATAAEAQLAAVLTEVLGVERVSVDHHFFDDLGANSLLMAHFCARVREQQSAPAVSTKDVYLHPTIRELAAAVTGPDAPASETPGDAPPAAYVPGSTWRYLLCGAAQLLLFLGEAFLAATIAEIGSRWIGAGSGSAAAVYLRSITFGTATLVLLCTLPVLAKWTLVGRWTNQEIPVWSLRYLRFWLVKSLIRANPLALFTGSPLYVLYLRALGAKIGRRVVVLSKTVPVCTDLLTIGDDTIIRKDCSFPGYRVVGGVVKTGPVTIGVGAFVGEHTVVEIGASIGDGAQLGHASCLYAGQSLPAGERWHGSPAQPTQVDYRRVDPASCGGLRRAGHAITQILLLVLVTTPAALGIASLVLSRLSSLTGLTEAVAAGPSSWVFYRDALVGSLVLFLGAVVAGGVVVVAVPRALRRFLVPGRTYPLYGVHHLVHRTIRRLSNTKFYLELFGDSSYVVPYLRALGYSFPNFEQTGSTAGASIHHEAPSLVTIGRGTQVSDAVEFLNADYSNTSFRIAPVAVGERSFFGNVIAYPSGARVGDNCLIATKAMVPLDGPIREGVGLLGSPCFEIPRSVQRDSRFDAIGTGEELRRRLAAKNRYNLGTMGLFLAVRWFHVFALITFNLAAWPLQDRFGAPVLAGMTVGSVVFSAVYFAMVERILVALRPLAPQFRSIYEPYFWWHERYWKLQIPPYYTALLNGTPFKNLVWRLLGVRIGRRVFDDGLQLTEPPLVSIGDDCSFNDGTVIQCHSMEDSTFKSDHSSVEAGCTMGIGAFVHYGVTMRQGALLEADSFLMKGEQVAARARWGGNPARQA